MIAPRKSDQLFDLADILPTALHLAGYPGAKLAELFDEKTYIDGVDQAAFLVADDGLSARRSRIYTLNQYFAATRIDEFKGAMTMEIENSVVQKGDWGGFSGGIFTDTGGGITFNLYTNPQEDVSIGIRHIPMGVPIMAASAAYMKDLIKYPPQFKVGFMSNNPPVYDLLPKLQELRLKNMQEQGPGRPTP
jgi:arylsulfatase